MCRVHVDNDEKENVLGSFGSDSMACESQMVCPKQLLNRRQRLMPRLTLAALQKGKLNTLSSD